MAVLVADCCCCITNDGGRWRAELTSTVRAAFCWPVSRRRCLVTYRDDTCVVTCVVGFGFSLSVALTALIVSSEVAATNRSTAQDPVIVLRLAIGITYYVDGCGVAAVVLLWAAALLWTTERSIVPRYTLLPRQWAPRLVWSLPLSRSRENC